MESEELVEKIKKLTNRDRVGDMASEFIEGWWPDEYTNGFIEGFSAAYGLGLQDGIDIDN